jgi:uncharacterized protein
MKPDKKNILIGIICTLLGIILASTFYAHLILFTEFLPKKECPNTPFNEGEEANQFIPQRQNSTEIITRSVPIVAVSSLDQKGVVGKLTIKLIPGNANVLIDTNPFLETDLQYSANIAVTVAKLKTENYAGNKDFILSYEIDSTVIGGESAGAATAIATIAALQEKNIKKNVAITGTINHDGSIGRVGGILEKAKAAADAGYKLFLVPKGQTKIKYYEKVIEEEPYGFGFRLLNTRYIPKVVDIAEEAKKEWGIEIKEVSTIEEAMAYMIE